MEELSELRLLLWRAARFSCGSGDGWGAGGSVNGVRGVPEGPGALDHDAGLSSL